MANDKLSDGIRLFANDIEILETLVKDKIKLVPKIEKK